MEKQFGLEYLRMYRIKRNYKILINKNSEKFGPVLICCDKPQTLRKMT